MSMSESSAWLSAIEGFSKLNHNLQIKWLSAFSGELTLQFRDISQGETDSDLKLKKLCGINEIFHQISQQIGRKSLGVNAFSDEGFLEHLHESTNLLEIDLTGFLNLVNDVDNLVHCE